MNLFSVFFVVGLPDDEVEKAEGFIGEVGGGGEFSNCFLHISFFEWFFVVGLPDDEVEKAEGFKGEVGGGGFFWFA